jgi:mono/diheme cytochrome c family protein
MRRLALIAIPAALLLAGCGGSTVKPEAETVVGSLPQTTTQAGPKLPEGDAGAGKGVFASAGCGGCHTLKAAGSTGNIGPNLDQLKPSKATVTHQVEVGGGAMPAFKGQLSAAEIDAVAQFVSSSAGK